MTRMKLALVLIALLVFTSISLAASVQKSFTVVVDRTSPTITVSGTVLENGINPKIEELDSDDYNCIGGSCTLEYKTDDTGNANAKAPAFLNVSLDGVYVAEVSGKETAIESRIGGIYQNTSLTYYSQYKQRRIINYLFRLLSILTSSNGGQICFKAWDLSGNENERCINIDPKRMYLIIDFGSIRDCSNFIGVGENQDPRAAAVFPTGSCMPVSALDTPSEFTDYDCSLGGSDSSTMMFIYESGNPAYDGTTQGYTGFTKYYSKSDYYTWENIWEARDFSQNTFCGAAVTRCDSNCYSGNIIYMDSKGALKKFWVKLPINELSLWWLKSNSIEDYVYHKAPAGDVVPCSTYISLSDAYLEDSNIKINGQPPCCF